MTQKKILLKSMRALEFQCPLKFRCQTRDYTTFSVLCKGAACGYLFNKTVAGHLRRNRQIHQVQQGRGDVSKLAGILDKRGRFCADMHQWNRIGRMRGDHMTVRVEHFVSVAMIGSQQDGSLTPPSSKNLSKRCKRLIFLSIS